MDVDQLKAALLASAPEDFVDNFVLAGAPLRFSDEKIELVRAALFRKLGVAVEKAQIVVVGSAKLGFGLHAKRLDCGGLLPAFRPFGPDSDIDIAVTCPPLFEAIWQELSNYASSQQRIPWKSGLLGSYLVHGWLRPDHFPKNARLQLCDEWWDTMRALSADTRMDRRKIAGAPFHSLCQLRMYQIRGVRDCQTKLRTAQ
jgi:hypothetical protein